MAACLLKSVNDDACPPRLTGVQDAGGTGYLPAGQHLPRSGGGGVSAAKGAGGGAERAAQLFRDPDQTFRKRVFFCFSAASSSLQSVKPRAL